MSLVIVDGTNIVMRCAFGGVVWADDAARVAERMLARLVGELEATHLVVVFDAPGATWRHDLAPFYKATRTVSTAPFVRAAMRHFIEEQGWRCVEVAGWEADDVMATIAARNAGIERPVRIVSSDSDLLACVQEPWVRVVRPEDGGRWSRWTEGMVMDKYGVSPGQLGDWKALVGEASDNLPGIPGLGPKKAARLLRVHGSIDRLVRCEVPDTSNDAARVRTWPRAELLLLQQLAHLRRDAPVPVLKGCQLAR